MWLGSLLTDATAGYFLKDPSNFSEFSLTQRSS